MDHLKSEAQISELDINGNNDDDVNLRPRSVINSVNSFVDFTISLNVFFFFFWPLNILKV